MNSLVTTSHPSWGAWIEIPQVDLNTTNARVSHPSWGAWIEISVNGRAERVGICRTPHGVRGLKLGLALHVGYPAGVAPLMGCVD